MDKFVLEITSDDLIGMLIVYRERGSDKKLIKKITDATNAAKKGVPVTFVWKGDRE